jgi:preprotein translocase subunit SecG
MAEDATKNVTTILLILVFLGMMIFIAYRARQNRQDMLKNHQPKVAGEDTLEGGARHPQRFDEPDDEALEEMAKLLGEESEDEA